MGIKFNYEYVKSYVESVGYTLLSNEYINNSTKIIVQCDKKHEPYGVSFRNFYNHKRRCPSCFGKIKHTIDKVKKEVESIGYKLLSKEYINSSELLNIQCDKRHTPYNCSYDNFKQGSRCPTCNGGVSLKYDDVKQKIELIGYKLLSKTYKNATTKLKLICPKNHVFNATYNNFINHETRCPICSQSKGERVIEKWLIDNKINFIYDEPYFKDLLSDKGNPLRPDFILPDYKIWIEYDGEFHYKPITGYDSYKRLKKHDAKKDAYATKNGWKMIRLPYFEFQNISKILDENII